MRQLALLLALLLAAVPARAQQPVLSYENVYPGNLTQGLGTPVSNSSGNVAAATAPATLPAAAGKTTYITGFDFTSAGATAAAAVTCTVTGGSLSLSYTVVVAAGATLANTPLGPNFIPPLSAGAQNTAIVVSCPSLGAGNTNATMSAYGFQL